MEQTNIKLNRTKSTKATNVDEFIGVELEGTRKLIPTGELQGNIDEYQQYLKEKDTSNKYRMIFTVNPVCSNVLYNHITELVYKEGSPYCKLIQTTKFDSNTKYVFTNKSVETLTTNTTYFNGNPKTTPNTATNPITMTTRDTALSFDFVVEGFKYKPGLDIFNNHHLRRRDFVVLNRFVNVPEDRFNTIFDSLRDKNGAEEKGIVSAAETTERPLHLYDRNSIMPCANLTDFSNILTYSLTEKDGWLGFVNKSILPIPNYFHGDTGYSINRIMGDRRECDFIDLYPDRTLFSFVPKWNEYRQRAEYNWKYCITYPYKNIEDHPLVVSGITASFDEGEDNTIILNEETTPSGTAYVFNRETGVIRIRTNISHNISTGDLIHLIMVCTYGATEVTIDIPYDVRVNSIGKYGYDARHYFTIRFEEVASELRKVYQEAGTDEVTTQLFIKRLSNNRPCKYYIRQFRRLPNFHNTAYSNLNKIDDATIEEILKTNDFNSSVNKLAFSKNAYGDDLAQIVFNDIIDTTGLRDNLGRELSEVYLTILKNNAGYKTWYPDIQEQEANVSSAAIEYSHCFGKVTSGFDLPAYADEYNVHKLHNVNTNRLWARVKQNFPVAVKPCENELRMDESHSLFYGDIVELDETTLTETVLEKIQHRVNTAQREYVDARFERLSVDNIKSDDYDGSFVGETIDNLYMLKINNANTLYPANIAPEGYYYQAHYPILLHEYDAEVYSGYHTIVVVTNDTDISNSSVTIQVDKNYYFNAGDTIYFYDLSTNIRYEAKIAGVSSDFKTLVVNGLPAELDGLNIKSFKLFKPNQLMPSTAYDLVDVNGMYVWRDFMKSQFIPSTSELYDSTFTNGTHYIHKQINLYMRRQDPTGEYGLLPVNNNYGPNLTPAIAVMEVTGNIEDVSVGDYIEPGVNDCIKL